MNRIKTIARAGLISTRIVFLGLLDLASCGRTVPRTFYATDTGNEKIALLLVESGEIGLLDVRVESKAGQPPKYFLLAMSPEIHFGSLHIKIVRTPDNLRYWFLGKSNAVPTISGCLDIKTNEFYKAYGVDRVGSNDPNITIASFEGYEYPQPPSDGEILFDQDVAE
jgi:hypothetical protein